MQSKLWGLVCILPLAVVTHGCGETTSDDVQQSQQEVMLKEGTAQVPLPAITTFRERRLMKMILEDRDNANLITYVYLQSEMTGKLLYLGTAVGYGIPAATQYTNPQKAEYFTTGGMVNLPQADPNGLFSPASAEGTWLMMKDPKSKDVRPVYFEPRIVVSPFQLPTE